MALRVPRAALLLLVAQNATAGWHLTARPWKPSGITRAQYLEVLEKVCRFTVLQQNEEGAVIDPVIHREHQYATPYYAHAVGTLVHEQRALDLLDSGRRAMEHATKCFAGCRSAIPDQHGEFFIVALTGALPLYRDHVPQEQWREWEKRMKTARTEIVDTNYNNWETYPMKGE